MIYEVLFYNGWVEPPAYYLIDGIEGNTPEQALQTNLEDLTQQVRDLFGLNKDEFSDEDLQETIYVVRENGLIPARNSVRV